MTGQRKEKVACMNDCEFEQFVLDNGKDILKFCRMTCRNKDAGDELYQDTMLKLLEKKNSLDSQQNIKSYALSTSILLWKNQRRKYANRSRLIPTESIDFLENKESVGTEASPESSVMHEDLMNKVQQLVADLPEELRMPIHLFYSAEISIYEISRILRIPEGTVKSRMNRARQIIKKELEALGYD